MSNLKNKITLAALVGLSSTGCATLPEVQRPATQMVEEQVEKDLFYVEVEKWHKSLVNDGVMFNIPEKVYFTKEMLSTPEFQSYFGAQVLAHNSAYFLENPGSEHKPAHEKLVALLGEGKKLLIEVDAKGLYAGVDGYDSSLRPFERSLDGRIDASEMLPNHKDLSYHFPFAYLETRKVPEMVEVDIIEREKKVPILTASVGAGYTNVLTADDETYDFGGNLHGGNIFLTLQPRKTPFYFGGRFSVFGNGSSVEEEFDVAATEGPLAGEILAKNRNEYSLKHLGIGAEVIGGWQFSKYVGLELSTGIMHDWETRELLESVARYNEGAAIVGLDETHTSSDTETKPYWPIQVGLRFKLPYDFCLIPSGGIRTDFSEVDGLLNANFGYCPKTE